MTFKDKASCDVGGSVRESSILKQFAWKRTVHMSQLLVAHKQEAAPPIEPRIPPAQEATEGICSILLAHLSQGL